MDQVDHHFSRLALETLRKTFSEFILPDQDPFHSTEGWEALLHLIPHPETVNRLKSLWSDAPYSTSEERWEDFKDIIKDKGKKKDLQVSSSAFSTLVPTPDVFISFHRLGGPSKMRRKILSCSTHTLASMPKSPNIATIC